MSLGISHEKIATMTVSALLAGGINTFPLTPRPGGRLSKFVSFMVVVTEVHGTSPTLGFVIGHGPNGSNFATQSSTSVAAVASAPLVFVFDSTTGTVVTSVLGEFIQGTILFGGAAGAGATVEVWETRKPF